LENKKHNNNNELELSILFLWKWIYWGSCKWICRLWD